MCFYSVYCRSPNLLNSGHNNINNKSFRGSQSSLSTSSRTPSEQAPGSGPGSGPRDRPLSAYLPPHSHHLNQVNYIIYMFYLNILFLSSLYCIIYLTQLHPRNIMSVITKNIKHTQLVLDEQLIIIKL